MSSIVINNIFGDLIETDKIGFFFFVLIGFLIILPRLLKNFLRTGKLGMNNPSQHHFDLENTKGLCLHISNKQLRRMSRLFKLMGSKALTTLGGKLAKFSFRLGLPIPILF